MWSVGEALDAATIVAADADAEGVSEGVFTPSPKIAVMTVVDSVGAGQLLAPLTVPSSLVPALFMGESVQGRSPEDEAAVSGASAWELAPGHTSATTAVAAVAEGVGAIEGCGPPQATMWIPPLQQQEQPHQ